MTFTLIGTVSEQAKFILTELNKSFYRFAVAVPLKFHRIERSGSASEGCQIVADSADNAFSLKRRKSVRSIRFAKTWQMDLTFISFHYILLQNVIINLLLI